MNFCAVILAAGHGKRMNSLKPKVIHEVMGKPIIQYTIKALKELKPEKMVIVVGNGAEEVKKQITEKSVSFVTQAKLLGTGNALLEAARSLKCIKDRTTLVLTGDSPLITSKTLKGFLKKHKQNKNALSLLSFIDESLYGYGRILRNKKGHIIGIVEDKHATVDEKRQNKELNSSIYAIEPDIMRYLGKLKKHRSSGEYYLTDIISFASKNGKKVEAYKCPPEEGLGINTRAELRQAIEILNKRNISKWMKKGVTFINPSISIVHHSVTIGKDTIVYPNTHLEGNTSIGRNCIIYPGVRIYDSILEDRVLIKDNTLIENSKIRSDSIIGPFAHLRPHSNVGRNVKIGNFVEIKKSSIGDGTKVSHLSYLGDAVVGKNVNIGAGTITCNYDGQKKYTTTIKSGVFIGSDSQIIAPVEIGRGAYIAAGATVTKNVPAGALAISRVGQKNIKDWGIQKQLKVKGKKLKVKNRKK
ncbi:MAG: bifunctional UDP-N-acetylglucosamine diphosphorylase/glucosamine-1-phosphate N-acetyltransferase GlmU [Thermodesulfovibrionia bacterium]